MSADTPIPRTAIRTAIRRGPDTTPSHMPTATASAPCDRSNPQTRTRSHPPEPPINHTTDVTGNPAAATTHPCNQTGNASASTRSSRPNRVRSSNPDSSDCRSRRMASNPPRNPANQTKRNNEVHSVSMSAFPMALIGISVAP